MTASPKYYCWNCDKDFVLEGSAAHHSMDKKHFVTSRKRPSIEKFQFRRVSM